jgi:site-specific recombinase XerD
LGLPNRQAYVIPLDYCQAATAEALAPGLSIDAQGELARFDRYLAGRHRAANTRRLYAAAVRAWLGFGGVPGHVDGVVLARWLATRRRTCAVATVNLDLKALRAFYRLQVELGEATVADLQRIPRQRKVPPRAPRWLSDGQVGEVLGLCPLETFIGLRDYALVLTLYTTGLRAGELAGMGVGDFIDNEVIYVVGKGGKPRYVPTGELLAGVLNGYLHARGRTRKGKRSAFWLRADGVPLRNGRSIWEIVSRRIWAALGARSGGRVITRGGRPWTGHYPHELRASFATALLHRGMPLTAIAQLMGHADVATTAHYLGVDLEHLRAAARLHPRAARVST